MSLRRTIRAALGDRGAADPMLVIASIALSLVLIVGGSFAISGIVADGQNLGAKNDLDKAAAAEATARSQGGSYYAYDNHPDSEYRALERVTRFNTTDGGRVVIDVNLGGWIAASRSLTGKVFLRTSAMTDNVEATEVGISAAGEHVGALRVYLAEGLKLPDGFSEDDVSDLVAQIKTDDVYDFGHGGERELPLPGHNDD